MVAYKKTQFCMNFIFLLFFQIKMQRQYLLLFLYWFTCFVKSDAQQNVPVFPWPGPLIIPVDFPYFPDGRVIIQLSNNDTAMRELRIREGVIATLDCSARLNETIALIREAGLSLSALSRAKWYVQFIDVQGEFIGSETLIDQPSIGIIKYNITGRYGEVLTADGSEVPTKARRGGSGSYRCEVCYNNSRTIVCNSSSVFNNVIGDPPVLIEGKTEDFVMISNIEYRSVFGADFCISRDQGVNDEIEISISCSHNTSFPVKPEPTATYLRNGEPIEYGERYDFGRNTSLVGISNTFFIYADFSIPSQFDAALGNYTCTLSNLFGTSITTTTITECCKASDFPRIISDNRFIPTPIEGQIIAGSSTCHTGSSFLIDCSINTTAARNITWKKDNVELDEFNNSTRIRVQSVGAYTCCASTRCGMDSVTSIVMSTPTIRTGTGNVTSPSIIIGQNTCISQLVNITCQTSSSMPAITWVSVANATAVLGRSVVLTVREPGTYRCNVRNPCGTSSAVSTISRFPTVSISSSLSGSSGDCRRLKAPPVGVNLCPFIGERLSLRCSTDDPSAIAILTPPGSASSIDIPSVGVSQEGVYTCSASNRLCGTSQRSLTVRVYDPARINLTSTLPPSNSTTLTIGAGRLSSPVTVMTGQTVNLHCPYRGIESPRVEWYRRVGGTLVRITGTESGLSLINTTNNQILRISSYSDSFSGSYYCNVSNNAGDDSKSVTLESAVSTAEWRVTPWSECSLSCGGGMRTRNVTCVSSRTSLPVDRSLCDINVMPNSIEYCNLTPCCDTDRHSYCKLIADNGNCNKQEYKDVCCCTCKYYE